MVPTQLNTSAVTAKLREDRITKAANTEPAAIHNPLLDPK